MTLAGSDLSIAWVWGLPVLYRLEPDERREIVLLGVLGSGEHPPHEYVPAPLRFPSGPLADAVAAELELLRDSESVEYGESSRRCRRQPHPAAAARARAERLWNLALAGTLRSLSDARKDRLADRFRRLLLQSRLDPTTVNRRVGRFNELLRTPRRLDVRAQQRFRRGSITVPGQSGAGTAIPDYSRWIGPGRRRHVNLKANVLAGLPVADVIATARKNQAQALRNAQQLPPGDQLVLRYGLLRSAEPRDAVLRIHFAAGSPIAQVVFGTDVWDRTRWNRRVASGLL